MAVGLRTYIKYLEEMQLILSEPDGTLPHNAKSAFCPDFRFFFFPVTFYSMYFSLKLVCHLDLCGGQNNASSRPCCQSQASAGVIKTNMEATQQQCVNLEFQSCYPEVPVLVYSLTELRSQIQKSDSHTHTKNES